MSRSRLKLERVTMRSGGEKRHSLGKIPQTIPILLSATALTVTLQVHCDRGPPNASWR